MEAKKKTRGRQKIPIQLIESQDDLYASFSKRRLGLFKKASELCTLCDVEIGVIVFSPTDNPFSFFSPNMESVLARYVDPDKPLKMPIRAIEAHTQSRVSGLNKQLDDAGNEKHDLKKIDSDLNEFDKRRPRAWWEETPVKDLNRQQLTVWTAWFQNFKTVIEMQVQQLQNQAFNQQLKDFSDSLHDYVPAPYNPGKQVATDPFYIGDDPANVMNQYSFPTLPLNLPGGGGNYYAGESSSSAHTTSPNYFNLPPLPGGMCDGSSSSNAVFYPDQYTSYVSPGDDDLFGIGGGSGSGSGSGSAGVLDLDQYYAFPAPTAVQGGVGETEQQFGDPMASAPLNHLYFPDPLIYGDLPPGAEDSSDAAETYLGGDY